MGGERIIEMTWRCSACQTQNLGRHKACQKCGNPKDASEEYEMPSDTRFAPTVTDPNLLRMATAGPDWRCRFCGADQRRLDGACANCGAPYSSTPPIQPAATLPRKKTLNAKTVILGLFATLFAMHGGCWGLLWLADRPTSATVSAVSWEHVIDVERYALRPGEGFKEAIPADAINVKRLGQRVHHTEKVQSGWTIQSFVDTVPDGTRLETYRVREACGEDCTTTPETCREVCKSNSNGFATCRQVCSGGRRKCTTRYCSSTQTREVPQKRSQVKRMRVPAYRDEPRYADAFSYQVWSWAPDRTVKEAGTDPLKLRWPAGARTGLPAGEQEREKRSARYIVTLKYHVDDTIKFEVRTPAEFARFAVGSEHSLVSQYKSGGDTRYRVNGAAVSLIP